MLRVSGRPRPGFRAGALACAVAAALLLTGCQIKTTVSLNATSSDHGTVAVSVTLDRAAVDVLGGQAALASELSVSDLKKEGWAVTGPSSGPGSSTTVTATHSYSSLDEASQLLAGVAGSGSAAARPYEIHVSRHSDFWHSHTSLSGKIDLTCGVGCFGDSGLQGLLGYSTGVDPTVVEKQTGQNPSQAFSFKFEVHMPGKVDSSNAASRSAGNLSWQTALGRSTLLSATSEQVNSGSVALVATLGSVGLVALLTLLGFLLYRRRSRRRTKALHAKPKRRILGAVSPRS